MTGRLHFSLAFLFCMLAPEGVSGLQWSSAGSVPDNMTLPVCPGSQVRLPWAFRCATGEQLVDVEWRYKADGSSEVVLATEVNGHFFADASNGPRLEYMGTDAGVRLQNVQIADSGVYSVHVNLERNGVAETQVQSVNVIVTDDPISTTSVLQVDIQGAQFVNSTQQHQLILTCGTINPMWAPQVHIVWTTPTNQTLPGTYQDKGQFTLAVPNPVRDGPYTCKIDNSSPAAQCLRSDSPLTEGASVQVDGVQARLVLMDSEMATMMTQVHGLQAQNGQLSSLLHTLAVNNSHLAGQIHHLQAENAGLETALINAAKGAVGGDCNFDLDLCGYTQATHDDFDWIRIKGPTSSSGTGPSSDRTNATGHYMYTEASSHRGMKAMLLSPQNPQTCGDICVAFYYHMYGDISMGTLNLLISNSTGLSKPLFSVTGNKGNMWINAKVTVPAAYLALPYRIVFESIIGISYLSDIAIDDVTVTRGGCQ